MDYREKEHAFTTIEKDLKGGKVPRVVLLCGETRSILIEWYAQTLIRRYVSDACRALDQWCVSEGDSLTLERIREGLETVSLMSERKVVFLPNFLPAAGKAVRGFPESDCKALAEVSFSGDGGQYAAYVRAGSGRTETEEKCDTASGGKVRKGSTIFSL